MIELGNNLYEDVPVEGIQTGYFDYFDKLNHDLFGMGISGLSININYEIFIYLREGLSKELVNNISFHINEEITKVIL